MTSYRYRNPEKRRAYMRQRMQMRRLWTEHKNGGAAFFREWARLFIATVSAL